MKYILAVLLVLLLPLDATALENEAYYSDNWCIERYGKYKRQDVRVEDFHGPTYPDCIVGDIVIEADWASKWYEGVGQMFHYARMTGKKPGILLILKEPDDAKYLHRLLELEKWFESGASKVEFTVYHIEAWKE